MITTTLGAGLARSVVRRSVHIQHEHNGPYTAHVSLYFRLRPSFLPWAHRFTTLVVRLPFFVARVSFFVASCTPFCRMRWDEAGVVVNHQRDLLFPHWIVCFCAIVWWCILSCVIALPVSIRTSFWSSVGSTTRIVADCDVFARMMMIFKIAKRG